jgi:CO/xanthine dehydrogenase FAD-binding subunit
MGLRWGRAAASCAARAVRCADAAWTQYADPASEWCLLAATLDAELVLVSRHRQRNVRPSEYFVGALTTTLEPDELLTEIRLPLFDGRWRTGFAEFSRRAGDFALAMCAAFLRLEEGRIAEARLGIGGTHCHSRVGTDGHRRPAGNPPRGW